MKYIFQILLQLFCLTMYAQQSDLRGPIRSDQFKVNHTKEGIFVSDFKYKPFQHSTLNSNWIWINSQQYPDQQTTKAKWIGRKNEGSLYMIKFKKVINIDGKVAVANVKLSADLQYRLFVNGILSARGPANIGSDYDDQVSPQHWFYDQFETKNAFRNGMNVIAIEVYTQSIIASVTTMGRGGLIMEANIKLKSGKNITLKTDSSWICQPSKAYVNKANMSSFDVDASKETSDWYTNISYNKTWSHAIILPDSVSGKWKLRQSELPQMMEERIFPVKVSKIGLNGDTVRSAYPIIIKASDTPHKIRLEFDNLYAGYLGFKVNGKAGTKLNMLTKEIVGKTAQEVNYILNNGTQTYEFPNLIDGKYIDVIVTNPDGDLKIDEIVINHSSFPVSYSGNFNCSDSLLNAVWKNIRWITQMNMQTYHLDSPMHQEPVSDAGDYLIESMVNYYTFSSTLLVKQDLRKIALVLNKTDNKMFHTSYMLLWVQMLLNYYEYTGDKELLKELAPNVFKLLAQFHSYVGKTGIITEAPNYMFMDWGSIYGIGFHHPPASLGEGYMTAFYYKAVIDGVKIASYLNDTEKSAALSAEAIKLKADFVQNLYDKKSHLFKNGISDITTVKPGKWLPKDTLILLSLPYVNTLAVLYGLAPVDKEKSILNYILKQKEITISPYFMYFVFEAIAKVNAFDDYGTEQLRRWDQLSQYPVGLKEGWAMGDYSHAWGGSPGYELPSKILGVSPAKPGFKEVLINPTLSDLKWAKGIVPTPNGNISVSWNNTVELFTLKSKIPSNMPVTFILPTSENCDVTINGKKSISGNILYKLEHVTVSKIGNNKIMIQMTGGNDEIQILKK